jgi:ferric-dicitrate binding protein FerR (iron transport regulator)
MTGPGRADCGHDQDDLLDWDDAERAAGAPDPQHVATCAACGERLRFMREGRRALQAAYADDPLVAAAWARLDDAVLAAAARVARERARGELKQDAPASFGPSPWAAWLDWLALGATAAAVLVALSAPSRDGRMDAPLATPLRGEAADAATLATATGVPREVAPGERIDVLPDGPPATLSLASGTHVVLAPGAGARIDGLDETSLWLRLERGRADAEVTPLSGDEFFVVETARARVSVLGTAFTIEAAEDGVTSVEVAHGVVRVEPAADAGRWRMVPAGARARVAAAEVEVLAAVAPAPSPTAEHAGPRTSTAMPPARAAPREATSAPAPAPAHVAPAEGTAAPVPPPAPGRSRTETETILEIEE